QPDKLQPGLVQSWTAQQAAMRERMRVEPLGELPRFVAGADGAFSMDKTEVLAVALVWDREENRIVELASARRPVEFPYIPGYLSFREGPALLEAIGRISHPWEVICCDGQGYAHPRRCGLATHIGVTLDVRAIGVAKSRLIGTYEEPAAEAGASTPLMHKDEQIGR